MSIGSSRRVVSTPVTDRKTLDDALEYVSKSWMPISQNVMTTVREKLQAGEYELKRHELVEDLRKDFSLFSWFLSQIQELEGENVSTNSFDLEEIVADLEIKNLIEVFARADEAHMHRRDGAIKSQNLALKQGLTAVATAQVLAEKKKLDANLVQICAGARQLGVNLVAWNYPRIFSRAVEHCQKTNGSLDKELLKILGYSPLQLGTELTVKWDKTGSLRALVNQDSNIIANIPADLSSQLGGEAVSLVHCVKLSEAVAQLATPEIYPAIAGAMPDIIAQVDQVLGKGGFNDLRSQLRQSAKDYSAEGTEIIQLDIEPEVISRIAHNHLAMQLVQANPWVSKCPALFQERFNDLYMNIDKHKVSAAAVNILVGAVIPTLGFTRGCVYMLEDSKNKLNPILRIGDAPLSRYRQLDCSASEQSAHPVVAALGYSSPIVQENVPVNGEFVSHVSGVFSGKSKTGVLYLEMSENLTRSADRTEALIFFKAVRQALSDCLNLS